MNKLATTLSYNIKYLRKELSLSQEELAKKMDIKRSNIAAYESKNVEPRLRVILQMSKYFDVSVSDLVETKIYEGETFEKYGSRQEVRSAEKGGHLSFNDNVEINSFIDKSMKIKQILDGFKAFYLFKRKNISTEDHDKQKLLYDIDNFIELMEHLMSYNEKVISAISKIKSN